MTVIIYAGINSTYIFTEDVVGRTLMHALAEAGKRGVEAHVLIDPSHHYLPDRYVNYLQESGVLVKEYHPMGGESILRKLWQTATHGIKWMNNRSHDKMVVVERKGIDGRREHVAYLGSSNLVDAHFQLDPTLIYEKEPGLLQKAMAVFDVVRERIGRYLTAGGKDSKEINKIIDDIVAKEARGNLSFAKEVKARIHAVREKYHDLGYQYMDVNYLVKGQAARDLIDYHDKVWESGHAQARKINKTVYDHRSSISKRMDELKGLPIVLENEGRKIEMTFTKELYETIRKAADGAEVIVGGKTVKVDQRTINAIKRAEVVATIPWVPSQPGEPAPRIRATEFAVSPDRLKALLAAKPGDEFLLEKTKITVTKEIQNAVLSSRFPVRLPGGQLVELSLDDFDSLKNAQPGAEVRVGTFKLKVTPDLRAQLVNADPDEATRLWVKQAYERIQDVGYIDGFESRDAFAGPHPHKVGKIELFLDEMKGNTPQGSEQGPLEVFRRATGGDIVKVDGREILYTADLFRDLERAAVGDLVDIGGTKTIVTEDIMRAFAKATPGDEILLLNQYGQLTPEFRDEMTAANKRGVKVTFVVNGPRSMWDGALPLKGYALTFEDLVATGAKVVEYPKDNVQVHAKIYTVTNPMAAYAPTEIEKKYAPQKPVAGGKLRFRDVLHDEMAKAPLNPRHVRGFTVTGTSNIDARSLSKMPDQPSNSGYLQRIVDWSRGLRNSEINFGIHSLGFAQQMNLKVQQAGAAGKVVADRGRKVDGVVRSCSQAYSLLGPLI